MMKIKIDRLDHIVLTVKDIARTCAFYSSVLGMDVSRFAENRVALRFGEQKINLHPAGNEFEPRAHHPVPGSADVCFITTVDIEYVVAVLQENNVEIIAGPMLKQGALGPITSVYFYDPDGNLLEISNYSNGES